MAIAMHSDPWVKARWTLPTRKSQKILTKVYRALILVSSTYETTLRDQRRDQLALKR